jgi:glycogen synthase
VPIATRVSGCVDYIVPRETGLFFESVEIPELAARLREAAATPVDQWLAMSRNVEERGRQLFDMRSVVKAYQNIYARLVPARAVQGQ